MKRLLGSVLSLAIFIGSAQAMTIPLTADGKLSMAIKLNISDPYFYPLTGQTLATVDIYYSCANQTETAFTEGSATLTEIDPTVAAGQYWLFYNTTLVNCAPPNQMVIMGGGTDIQIFTDEPVFVAQADLSATTVTGQVVSSGDCANSATTFDTTLGTTYATNGPTQAGVRFMTGALTNEIRRVSSFNINGCITFGTGFSGTPVAGTYFIMIDR